MDDGHRTPGQLIAERLAARGWTGRVLALVLGMDETVVNKIITGKRRMDAESALAMGEVLGVAPEALMALETSYQLAKARLVTRPDPARAVRAHLLGGLPITEMIKRGWIDADDPRDVPRVSSELVKFFRANSLEEIEILPHAAKRSNVAEETTPVQLAWLYRVKEIATEMLAPRYTQSSADAAVGRLRALLPAAEEARKVPRILAESGIRFLLVEQLPGSKIDGVCFWLDERSPVVAMTMRYDRIDNFWFVLRHELEHVRQRHGQTVITLDTELEGDRAGTESVSDEERVANAAGAEFCVPSHQLDKFIARKEPFFAERDILGFAKTLGVHPGIVAGQLQRRTGRYDRFRVHQVKIRAHVAPGAIVDGWGDVAPIDPRQ